MRNDKITQLDFKRDLKTAFRLDGRPLPKLHSMQDLKSQVEIVMDGKEAVKRLNDLAAGRGILAFDYETTGLKPDRSEHRIVSCSFCFEGRGAWACMIGEEQLEPLSRVLFNRDLLKVASNMKFEERWTRRVFGRGVASWYWDTMLAAHCLDNRPGICSIKFQAFIRLGVGGWEQGVADYLKAKHANDTNRIDRVSRKELLIYNALDSLLEFKVMQHQRREMGLDGHD